MIRGIIEWIENKLPKLIIFGSIFLWIGSYCWKSGNLLYQYCKNDSDIDIIIAITKSLWNALFWFHISTLILIIILFYLHRTFYKKASSLRN